MKLIIISNRLPLKIVENESGFDVTHSQGGVATGLDSLELELEKHWVGWPGMYVEADEDRTAIDKRLLKLNYHPVHLTPGQIENYYEGYSNSVLWPMCHYFPNYVQYNKDYLEAYREVNRLFCDAVLSLIEPNDVVWVQDYQLMLVPAMIREKIFNVSIGYFHHIPFPSYELFRSLPERAELLKGLLGADLISFHTHGYMRHFISAVYRVLKLDCELDEINLGRRVVDVDAFPMGINYTKYYDAILNPDVKQHAEELKNSFGDVKLILSVDRLDYSKGILLRLKCFEYFLQNHPEYLGKVSLAMIVSPSRDTVDMYAELKSEIDKKVGAINGIFSTANWNPIYYFYRSFDFEEVTALYHIADIALITPLRDGMNLVAKEYIAAKRDKPGMLILSEMAGASIELSDAIIVNPNDEEEIQQAIVTALEMPEEEQMKSLKAMQKIISIQTVEQWAKDFIAELLVVRERNKHLQQKIIGKSNLKLIKEEYNKAKKRLILLDYDGTLVAFKKDPLQAHPTPKLLSILKELAADPKNQVVISSGRDKNILDKWLGDLPIGLSAEHGSFYKTKGKWHGKATKIEWEEEILDIMNYIVRRTPNSKLEIKKTALVFHYRDVDVWLADLRINQLMNVLVNRATRKNLQIMKGNKILEVKYPEFNKGTEALRLIGERNYDFIMAIGDDTTDEEMFIALPAEAITIKVGKDSKNARFTLPEQAQTLGLLGYLSDRQEPEGIIAE